MTDEPEDRGPPDNLWAPVPGDFGAHGVFDDRAKDTSLHLSVVTSGLWTEARQIGDWISSKITGTLRRKPRDARAGFDMQNRSDSAPGHDVSGRGSQAHWAALVAGRGGRECSYRGHPSVCRGRRRHPSRATSTKPLPVTIRHPRTNAMMDRALTGYHAGGLDAAVRAHEPPRPSLTGTGRVASQLSRPSG